MEEGEELSSYSYNQPRGEDDQGPTGSDGSNNEEDRDVIGAIVTLSPGMPTKKKRKPVHDRNYEPLESWLSLHINFPYPTSKSPHPS